MTSNEATTAQINSQLETMIAKLRQKVQLEVQQRIENQRKLNSHLQQVGAEVSEMLIVQFDKQMKSLVSEVDSFETNLLDWEMKMQMELARNNNEIQSFESDINYAIHDMSVALNSKFKVTSDFDLKVTERMDIFKESFQSQNLERSIDQHGFTIAQLEHDRIQKELKLTKGIVDFNNRV